MVGCLVPDSVGVSICANEVESGDVRRPALNVCSRPYRNLVDVCPRIAGCGLGAGVAVCPGKASRAALSLETHGFFLMARLPADNHVPRGDIHLRGLDISRRKRRGRKQRQAEYASEASDGPDELERGRCDNNAISSSMLHY